ncbi:hypothetical protein [Aquimarina mytili]|uniref:Uncharacterized protein n=1 Tax=Aquimarina mytili TaxID=874423 RepID=A0A936ZPM7_9FLAO|nr:hypothetical protein [Aquimarina mytili]MBL0683429.1 hypothetical protein [Aquimarina mytili]
MKTFFIVIAFLTASNCLGQIPYFDSGFLSRVFESNSARGARRATQRTTIAYNGAAATTAFEYASRTRLNFNPFSSTRIDYIRYRNMCNAYLNPFKKRKCTNRFNYLKEAHTQVMDLMKVHTSSQINQGVKEQIVEKYASITNTIFNELEQMKIQAEKNRFSRFLIAR